MTVLVTGATGYVGGRLVPALLEAGHEVRTTTSSPDREQLWWVDRVDTVVMDILDADDVASACEGIDAVYYLVHGMGGDDFAENDRTAAQNMVAAVQQHGIERVVYLSGIVPDVPEDELSEHIASRLEVERILGGSSATVITLRAAVIMGSDSTSFEIIRQVSERMPVRTVPDWMRRDVQPIAVVDVIAALVGALTVDGPTRHVDVGGNDVLAYPDLLDRYAELADLTRPEVEIPLLPTHLVGTMLGGLTDVPSPVVHALVESLHHDMVCAPGVVDGRAAPARLPDDGPGRVDSPLARRTHRRARERRPHGPLAPGPRLDRGRRRPPRHRQGR
ncbi:MAG: NAD(P)H-binding protein [Mobilicoccus sp.]|nr:NAD(P)H-binding protein [Mobilicoccus sp.]